MPNKYDGTKPRVDLVPSSLTLEVGKVLTFGAEKYNAHNWRSEGGLEWSRLYAAAQRHLLAWNDGETFDEESGLNHLSHAASNIAFLLEYAKTDNGVDDRYTEEDTINVSISESNIRDT